MVLYNFDLCKKNLKTVFLFGVLLLHTILSSLAEDHRIKHQTLHTVRVRYTEKSILLFTREGRREGGGGEEL